MRIKGHTILETSIALLLMGILTLIISGLVLSFRKSFTLIQTESIIQNKIVSAVATADMLILDSDSVSISSDNAEGLVIWIDGKALQLDSILFPILVSCIDVKRHEGTEFISLMNIRYSLENDSADVAHFKFLSAKSRAESHAR